jgi:hypothetical protein
VMAPESMPLLMIAYSSPIRPLIPAAFGHSF